MTAPNMTRPANPMLALARAEGQRPRLPPSMGKNVGPYEDQKHIALEFIKRNPDCTAKDVSQHACVAHERAVDFCQGFKKKGLITSRICSGHGKRYARYTAVGGEFNEDSREASK
jgi:predicted HTH transcriptional regulator